MDLLFTAPNSRVNSDLAFWGKYAVHCYYRNDQPVGGFRIFDISNPAAPQQLVDFPCDGLQATPSCGTETATRSPTCCCWPWSAHDDPNGWEGVRVFTLSDDPADPFATIQQVKAVYTDCGAHTITAWPDLDDNRLLVYVSSYPLRPGPTCGQVNGPRVGRDPLHGGDPGPGGAPRQPRSGPRDRRAAHQLPGDPDNQIDWCERGRGRAPRGILEPAAPGCHDIAVHVELRLAAAACAEQGQVWRVDDNGIPDTAHPILIGDDEVSSGGTGNPRPPHRAADRLGPTSQTRSPEPRFRNSGVNAAVGSVLAALVFRVAEARGGR
jgi:hypothetical protein